MTIPELARLKFYETQDLDPNAEVPKDRLRWSMCLALSDRDHPDYAYCYELMAIEAFEKAIHSLKYEG